MFGSPKQNVLTYRPGQELPLPERFRFSDKHSSQTLEAGKGRLLLTMLGFCAAFLIVGVRLCDVSLRGVSAEIRREEKPQTRAVEIKMERADITDRNGVVLATSLPSADLYIDTDNLKKPETLAAALAETLPDVKYKPLLKKLKSGKKFVYVKRNLIPRELYEANRLGFPQLNFETKEMRIYPQGALFAHVLGSTDIDNNGISGIEKAFNKKLSQDKENIRLSLDVGIQSSIRTVLMENIEKYSAEGAAAILMNAKTGEIVSMVSLPDYDPNNLKNAAKNQMFNAATLGVYEVGSVMKMFNTAIGLETKKIKATDTIDASRPVVLANYTIQDVPKLRRELSVPEIMIHSSNIGSAKIALAVGAEKQREYLKKFGFFNAPQIELPEKGRPLYPSTWRDVSTATIGYGYGLSVSPLHVVAAAAAVVNGGVYHAPTLLSRRFNQENIGHRVISDKTSRTMRAIMREVVIKGSGRRANVAGFEVGGKTGSARKLVNGKYVEGSLRTSFLSAFPMDDPQYVLMVMLDSPKKIKETYYLNTAAWNAVPTAEQIITTVAPQLGIMPRPFDPKREAPYVKAALEAQD
ncbi:MAG TPA: penicillin-binding protein [Alphaproteobacteria bacterium]|mgnify:FL=1|nr:penicillin-binding protein [Alphaproteobacteria bacterium]